jgi:hypothetical protein
MSKEDVSLFFSVAEKTEFLERNGYVIMRQIVEIEENIYQNKFVPMTTLRVTAIRGEYKEDVHKAFERELRNKLLLL